MSETTLTLTHLPRVNGRSDEVSLSLRAGIIDHLPDGGRFRVITTRETAAQVPVPYCGIVRIQVPGEDAITDIPHASVHVTRPTSQDAYAVTIEWRD
ncbi:MULTISPECIES: hypothetical protein [Actinomycetes]|uniref:hypothetical protein n=1 Tax=Actinomycetes TaxID=1760 RepID=UPI0033D9FB50